MKALRDQFSTMQLNKLLTQFPEASIHRGDHVVTVETKDGKVMLSAISSTGANWSVRADGDMFPPECYWSNHNDQYLYEMRCSIVSKNCHTGESK